MPDSQAVAESNDPPRAFSTPADVTVRDAAAAIVVQIAPAALARMEAEPWSTWDACNVAGALFASSRGDPLRVVAITGPGYVSQADAAIDSRYSMSVDHELLARGSDLHTIGTWHRHREGHEALSGTDRYALAVGLIIMEARGRSVFVDLIGGPTSESELHAFVAHRDPESGEVIIENARLEVCRG